MRIAAWNLNHRVLPKNIPKEVEEVIGEIAPDVLVLTEYVDGEFRAPFKTNLQKMGYFLSVSKVSKGHNQVLMATREKHSPGSVVAPDYDSHANSNFLSIRLPESALEIVGIRAPAYEKTSEVDLYWAALKDSLARAPQKRTIVIGDLNGDPNNSRSRGGRHLCDLRESGWTIPSPVGEWSYISSDGKHKSRIDHVLATADIEKIAARYETKIAGHTLAGEKEQMPLSDHAALVVDL